MMRKVGLVLVCCAVALAEPPVPPPSSIYFVAYSRSDSIGDWADYVLDLRTEDGEVLVRSVRIGPPTYFCSTPIIVKAYEQRLDLESYESLLSEANPCAIKPKAIKRAMRSRGPVDLMEHPVNVTMVATCGGETKVLNLPHLAGYRRPRNARVARLRDLYWDIKEKAFPAELSFRPSDLDEDYRLQEVAVQFVAEMQAGAFDEGGTWKYVADGYEGPVRADRLLTGSLLPTELEFTSFVAPSYPPLALSARIQGTVRLSLEFASDGSVSTVAVLEGPGLLASAAEKAATTWRVDPASVPSKPTEVAIAFEFACGNE